MRAHRRGAGASRAAGMLAVVLVLLAGCSASRQEADDAQPPSDGVAELTESDTATPPAPVEEASPSPEPDDGATAAATEAAQATEDAECAAIADDLIDALQVAVDEAGSASVSAVLEGDALSPQTRARLEELRARATAADCGDRELADLLRARADRIEGAGMLAELLRSALRSGQELPL